MDSNAPATEVWLPARGFPDYEVSSFGRVRSHKRGNTRCLKLTPRGKAGYLCVMFCAGGGRHMIAVHRLVLETFAGTAPCGTECCHGNDNPADNRLENLRWDTHKANLGECVARNRHPRIHGEAWHSSRLREIDVMAIRQRYCLGGTTQAALAAEYGVSVGAISMIVNGKRWKHSYGG